MKNSDQFYQSGKDWAYDMYESQALWLRRVIFALIMMTVLLMLSLASHLMLLPLKQKVPYLYAFDHATGEVTHIGTLEPSKFSSNWELSRYLLMQYVIQYESYDFDNIELPYQHVWAQSADGVQKQYESLMQSSNPISPYKQYGKDKFITTKVVSVNRLNDNTVDVKFTKTIHDRLANTEQTIPKEAIVKWEFSEAQTTQKMLERDPLGFKVTYYQVSQVNIDKE